MNSGAGLSRPTAFRVQTLQPLGYISKYVSTLLIEQKTSNIELSGFWLEKLLDKGVFGNLENHSNPHG